MRAFMSEKGRERGKDRKRAPRLCSKRERERERERANVRLKRNRPI